MSALRGTAPGGPQDPQSPAEPVGGTPRTDAEYEANGHEIHSESADGELIQQAVDIEFARQLERELEAMTRAFTAEEGESYRQAKRAEKAEREVAGLRADGERFRWWAKWWTDPNDDLETINSVGAADTPDEFRAAIDAALVNWFRAHQEELKELDNGKVS